MQIIQSVKDSKWVVRIKFVGYRFSRGEGPFFLTGTFNNWQPIDMNYQIKYHPQVANHVNEILPIELGLSLDLEYIDFKIIDGYYPGIVNPNEDVPEGARKKGTIVWLQPTRVNEYTPFSRCEPELYRGEHELVFDGINNFNIRVRKEI